MMGVVVRCAVQCLFINISRGLQIFRCSRDFALAAIGCSILPLMPRDLDIRRPLQTSPAVLRPSRESPTVKGSLTFPNYAGDYAKNGYPCLTRRANRCSRSSPPAITRRRGWQSSAVGRSPRRVVSPAMPSR